MNTFNQTRELFSHADPFGVDSSMSMYQDPMDTDRITRPHRVRGGLWSANPPGINMDFLEDSVKNTYILEAGMVLNYSYEF